MTLPFYMYNKKSYGDTCQRQTNKCHSAKSRAAAEELYPEVNNSNNRKANNFGDDNEEGTALMQKNKQKSIAALSNSIAISPNPADEILTIKMPTGINSIEIVSIEGKLIRTINVTNTGLNIDVSNLDNGLYTFIFKSSSITPFAKKVTIIH